MGNERQQVAQLGIFRVNHLCSFLIIRRISIDTLYFLVLRIIVIVPLLIYIRGGEKRKQNKYAGRDPLTQIRAEQQRSCHFSGSRYSTYA